MSKYPTIIENWANVAILVDKVPAVCKLYHQDIADC